MNKFLLVLLSVGLSACSFNKPAEKINEENLIVDTGIESYSFGENIQLGATVSDKVFSIGKGALASVAISGVSIEADENSAFVISTSSGCNRSLVKVADKCTVKVKFLKNKVAGDYDGILRISAGANSKDIALSASVINPDSEDEAALLKTQEGTTDITSLNFGLIAKGATLSKILTIKNDSSRAQALSISLDSSNFVIQTNNCASSLAKNKSCNIKIQAKGPASSLAVDTPVSAVLNLGVKSINLNSTHKAEVVAPADLRAYDNGVEVSSLNFGSHKSGQFEKIILIKNIGGSPGNLDLSLSGSMVFSVIDNYCPENLGAFKNCYLKIRATLNQQPQGIKNANLSLGTLSISLSITVPPKYELVYDLSSAGYISNNDTLLEAVEGTLVFGYSNGAERVLKKFVGATSQLTTVEGVSFLSGSNSIYAYGLPAVGNMVYFQGQSVSSDLEFYSFNLVTNEVVKELELNPTGHGRAWFLNSLNNKIYYTGQIGSQWVMVTFEPGQTPIIRQESSSLPFLRKIRDTLFYFSPTDNILYKINPDSSLSSITTGVYFDASVLKIVDFNNKVYFVKTDKSIWSYSDQGVLVEHIAGSSFGTKSIEGIHRAGDNLIIEVSNSSVNRREIYSLSKNHVLTLLKTDLANSPILTNLGTDRSLNGVLVFSARDMSSGLVGNGTIWRTDGTPSGTYELMPVTVSNTYNTLRYNGVIGDKLYISTMYVQGTYCLALFESDGTVEGTKRVVDTPDNDINTGCYGDSYIFEGLKENFLKLDRKMYRINP